MRPRPHAPHARLFGLMVGDSIASIFWTREVTHVANLLVRNLDEQVVLALKERAARHKRSAEAEHRAILEQILLRPRRKSFVQVLASMPNVGKDEDFGRLEDAGEPHVFD